jgi:methylated-DNA-[protein]-cysteine S-methyltransferase
MNDNQKQLTAFQWKVLSVTASIPLGETRSYQWVAEKIGSPKAVRAVGQALRRNPYLVIIPCHRVIHADGSLGGYAGGSGERKAVLLKKERKIAAEMEKSKSGLKPRVARSRMKSDHDS